MEPFQPPQYIKDLIAAINDGAKSAQLGTLAFAAIGLFLLATAFSATDEDLLLNRALTISQLGGTAVPVVFAFGLAPAVFVAAHFYTLIRYDMLAGNVWRFLTDLPRLVLDPDDQDRCRQLLANVEFVSALVMPEGSRASSWMFRWTVRALLAVFPVFVALAVQLQSLRLQSEWVTWIHHCCIAADLVLLVWFFGRLSGDDTWNFSRAPFRRKAALCWMPAVVLLVDLAWLQVPGPNATTLGIDRNRGVYWRPYPGVSAPLTRQVGWLLRFNPVDPLLCTPGAWGCRYLTVTHRIVVARILDTTTFVALRGGAEADAHHRASFEPASLRGRTLRFADLTAGELFAADLTDADLRHVSLEGATLKAATFSFAQLQGANLLGAQLQGGVLFRAQLQSTNLDNAQLQGADLHDAQLQSASLRHVFAWRADARQATVVGARIEVIFTGPMRRCDTSNTVCYWGDFLASLRQLLERNIPDGPLKVQALDRVERNLDPAKPLAGEDEMATRWSELQGVSPPPDLYEKKLAEVWRVIGCAPEGAPFVVAGMASRISSSGLSPFASDSAEVPRLAAEFLKEDCAGAHGILEDTRSQLIKLRDTTPQEAAKPDVRPPKP
jgi:hypothetical protein